MNGTGHDLLIRSSENRADEYIGKDHLFGIGVEAELFEFVEVYAGEEFLETGGIVLEVLAVEVDDELVVLLQFDGSSLFAAMLALLVITSY